MDSFFDRVYDKDEREKLKEILIEKYKGKIKKFSPLKNKISKFEKRIVWEKEKAKELISRRSGLNDFLQSRAVVN